MFDYIRAVTASGSAVPLHRGAGRALVSAQGLVGLASQRASSRPRPEAHGAINDTRWLEDRLITLVGECWGSSPAAALASFDQLTAALYGSLSEPLTLQWQRAEGGEELQCVVKVASDVLPTIEGGGRFVKYQAQLRADDPRVYSQRLTTIPGAALSEQSGGKTYPYAYPYRFAPAAGGKATAIVGGSIPTPPLIRIYGFARNPAVELESTGQRIVLTGEIAAGSFVDVDLTGPAPTVKLNGTTPKLSLVDFAASSFWELPPGPQTISLTAAAFDLDARADVLYRAARL